MLKNTRFYWALLFALTFATSAIAEPDAASAAPCNGPVTAVNYGAYTVTIGSSNIISLDSRVMVHYPDGRSGSLALLHPGQWIICSASSDAQESSHIQDIWVIPSGPGDKPSSIAPR